MSITHLHLLLNHFPVVGIVGLVVLFAIAWQRRSTELGKVTLGLTMLLAAVAAVVYLTGEPAEKLVEKLPGFDETLVEAHEEAALVALLAFGALGVMAAGALLRYRGRGLPRGVLAAGLAGSLVTGALVGWTANLGGQIRHTEIRGASSSVASGGGERAERAGHDER